MPEKPEGLWNYTVAPKPNELKREMTLAEMVAIAKQIDTRTFAHSIEGDAATLLQFRTDFASGVAPQEESFLQRLTGIELRESMIVPPGWIAVLNRNRELLYLLLRKDGYWYELKSPRLDFDRKDF